MHSTLTPSELDNAVSRHSESMASLVNMFDDGYITYSDMLAGIAYYEQLNEQAASMLPD